jgi:NADH:ubiquinone oxidoreductase subunit 3 (subunit A)
LCFFSFFIMFFFLLLLTIGLVYEWKKGALDWI